ncbi:MAG: response regulator transcription factor [Candidatus Limivivens sp.]|nr:response regulator transcription factor [Candidatus Limivivens sp.]
MHTVLLVDDEQVIVRNMKQVIPWEKLGFQIIASASDGEEAYRLVEQKRPELVITDVMMPRMNGIELSEKIKKDFPGTEIIIISGYDEFDYAQSAMRAGVVEYLLKPTQRSELEETLSRVHNRIMQKKSMQENMEKLRGEVQKQMQVMKNQFFCDLLYGAVTEGMDISRTLQYYRSPLKGSPYYLCCFDLDEDIHEKYSPEKRALLWLQLNIIISNRLQEMEYFEYFERGASLYHIFEQTSDMVGTAYLEELLTEAIQELRALTGISVSVGISRKYPNLDRLFMARRDCEIALEERCNMGENSCIPYEEIRLFEKDIQIFDNEQLNAVCVKIRSMNAEAAVQLVRAMYEKMKEEKAIYQQFYSQSMRILIELYNIAVENGEEFQEELRRLFAGLSNYKTADSLMELVIGWIQRVTQSATRKKGNKNKDLIAQVLTYVDRHIQEEITLQSVADAVHLSKNYLCSIFKKERGETFFNYLTSARINKAKELLKNTDFKVYTIAEKVGYTDYAYFAQVFKKSVGVTAVEYREIYQEND